MDRLTFKSSVSHSAVVVGRHGALPRAAKTQDPPAADPGKRTSRARERYDWDYLWMLAFTTFLFFRPQDHVPALGALHLAEMTAIAGLAAMAVRRLRAGLAVTKVNAALVGVLLLGAVIVLTTPFSIWPGGSVQVFSDIYVKIILIYALMTSTLSSPKRLHQMTWIMMVASGYIAGRAVFDYLRGVNLVEGDRVRGAVGGMFENPNDLALNLVTFLAPTLFIVLFERRLPRRLCAFMAAGLMLAAIVCTKSRSGFLGLVAMGVVVLFFTARMKPGFVFAAILAGVLALPTMPQSFWDRMESITNASQDQSGSREARVRLLNQGIQVFTDHPLTGIGAGQFKNLNDATTIERWRVTHNVWLQVAAEIGVFGLIVFTFLVVRAYQSCFATLAALRDIDRGPTNRGTRPSNPRPLSPQPSALSPSLSPDDRRFLDLNAKGMLAALVGWTVCSLFASVAFNWTFYFVLALAVGGLEVARAARTRRAAVPAAVSASAATLVRAHA